jgi:non-specific serine/threonine protein kinase
MRMEAGASLAHYRLIEKVGEGGMGVVWKALDTRLGREIAIKVLSEELASDRESLARFEREARAIAALNHPNIVTIHSVEEVAGVRFFTMELLAGRTLRELIPPEGMSFDQLSEIASAIADALGAAHERGIVHRDLKPANIVISEAGRVKVLDFGLAKIRQVTRVPAGSEPSTREWSNGRISGTLSYMSPEQLQGRSADHRSDLFAFGIILYEMATGRRPFQGESVAALAAAILTEDPLPPSRLRPELPQRFDQVVAGCLQKDPGRRTQTAAEVRTLLVAIPGEPPSTRDEPDRSVAVLPFADLSQQKDQGYFCEGIADEIITTLAQVENLRVASRIASFPFKDTTLESREIGRRLGARHLLSGSVRKAGEHLRITAELADVEAGERLWSERFDRDLQDIFAIQEEIARNIVLAMRLTLTPREKKAFGKVATTDIKAYDYYLRGRMYFYQFSRRGIEFARGMFARAVEVDPDYALAHTGLADCCTYIYMHVLGSDEMRASALEAARRAVELDPELAQARVSLGLALSLTRDHEAAEREFETALRLDPRLFEAHYFYARDRFMQGKLDQAAGLYERACELRPEDYQAPLLVGQIYEDRGEAQRAAEFRRRGLRAAENRLEIHPDDVRALYMGANALVALGETERGLEWAQRALALDPGDGMLLYNLACIFAMAGRREQALDFLERSVEAGMNRLAWVQHDSNLDSIRGDARYEAVVRHLQEGSAGG